MPGDKEEQASPRKGRKTAAGGSSPGSPAGAGGSTDTSNLTGEDTSVDILRRAARSTAASVELGDDTTRKLNAQGESMDRTSKSLAEAEYNLKVSQRLVKGMSSWGGMVASWFSRKPKRPKGETDELTKEKKKEKGKSGKAADGEEEPAQAQAESPGLLTKEEDELLDTIAKDVVTLRRQADDQQGILKDHEKKLGKIDAQVDRVDDKTRQTTGKIRKIL